MKYGVILADPPWSFKVWDKDTGQGRSAEAHYPTMELDEICALPVNKVAAENCALFLWSVWPRIFDAEKVIKAWGFEYKTLAWIWIKSNPTGFGHFTGMGHYTRANSEPCLLAVRGSMPVQDKSVLSVIYSAVRKHSQKPTEQYGKIEALYPRFNYLEMFARNAYSGWDAWGNEVINSIQLVAQPN